MVLKLEFALSDNIVAGKDGVNGKDSSVGATGKDGSSVVINGADGSIGMTGPKRPRRQKIALMAVMVLTSP